MASPSRRPRRDDARRVPVILITHVMPGALAVTDRITPQP
jgi:hypothetical protein